MAQDTRSLEEKRRRHNDDIIKRMRQGDSLQSYDSYDSWFPERPVIAKDAEAIAQLYGKKPARRPLR